MAHSQKTGQQKLYLFFKIAVSIGVFFYLYQLLSKTEYDFESFSHLDSKQWFLLILSVIFMPINWLLEAKKWHWLIKKLDTNFRYKQAIAGIFAGMSSGLFTPNRVGEYIGRLSYVKQKHRTKGIVLTFLDRIAQMSITSLFGLPAVLILSDSVIFNFKLPFSLVLAVVFLNLILFVLLLFPKVLNTLFSKNKFTRLLSLSFKHLRKRDILFIFALSMLRYFVFSFQFFFLILCFGYEGNPAFIFVIVASIFLLKSVIPSIAFSELGIRESIAITIFSELSQASSTAFNATFLLYLINIIIPALIGMYFVYKSKSAKS